MSKMTYEDLSKISGLPIRRIRFFSDQGLFSFPEQSPGRGRSREFTWQNLLELMIVRELSANNIELATIKRAMNFLREQHHHVFKKDLYIGDRPNYYLRVYPSGSLTASDDRRDQVPLSELFNGEASVLIVDLTQLAKKLPGKV